MNNQVQELLDKNIYTLCDDERIELLFYLIGYIEGSVQYKNDDKVKPSELIKKINKKVLQIKGV
jgi:hypothetical protein